MLPKSYGVQYESLANFGGVEVCNIVPAAGAVLRHRAHVAAQPQVSDLRRPIRYRFDHGGMIPLSVETHDAALHSCNSTTSPQVPLLELIRMARVTFAQAATHHKASLCLDIRDGLMSAKASCLGPCNLAPVMQVLPEGTYYGGLTEPHHRRASPQRTCRRGSGVRPHEEEGVPALVLSLAGRSHERVSYKAHRNQIEDPFARRVGIGVRSLKYRPNFRRNSPWSLWHQSERIRSE